MNIVGDRKYVEIPGTQTHELPPLLIRSGHEVKRLEKVMGMASDIVESEDLLPSLPIDDLAEESEVDRRRMDLAINLVEQYLNFVRHWRWGDSILEWIRQCEITFDTRDSLRRLLRPDVWPHAGRSSFVTLLADKAVPTAGIGIENALGFRLTFRQPPPISCFSNQFLFYLNSKVANTAYKTWADMMPEPVSSLPPERFVFQVLEM